MLSGQQLQPCSDLGVGLVVGMVETGGGSETFADETGGGSETVVVETGGGPETVVVETGNGSDTDCLSVQMCSAGSKPGSHSGSSIDDSAGPEDTP